MHRPPASPVVSSERGAPSRLRSWYRAIRHHQWLKNLLLAVPMLTSHRITDPAAIRAVALAFVAFGLVASGVYVLNDCVDVEADRQHPRKRSRPFAARELSVSSGVIGSAVLLLAGFGLAVWLLSRDFTIVLACYFAGTCAYSLWLKRYPVIDVALLAGLYVARIMAGAAAIPVALSFWLLAFSLHLFFSLALAKRYTELAELPDSAATAPGRGYRRSDLPVLQAIGVASGFVAVLVLALYIHSPDSLLLYAAPRTLWLLIPILIVWMSRLWLLAHRQELHDDPVVYAVTDPGSVALGLCGALVLLSAA